MAESRFWGRKSRRCDLRRKQLQIASSLVRLGRRSPVATSQSESFGLTALEAMACEVPVIAMRVGASLRLWKTGGCGYLFEPGDVDGMARAAVRILGDADERERLGRRSRDIAVSRFATEKIIPQYEELYRRVIEGTTKTADV